MIKELIIAHYKKNLDWINEIELTKDLKISIFSTSDNKYTYIPVNKGMDANMYLSFIIKNYEVLSDKILFLHHHKNDWTQDYDLPFIINNLNWECELYANIGARKNYSDLYSLDKKSKEYLENIWFLFEEYLEFPTYIKYIAGTQFLVDKSLILNYDKSFYEKLYNWLLTTNLPCEISGRIFEWTWHYIFTKNPIDKLIDYKVLLKNK